MGYKITVLPGDGIGPEITDSAIEILNYISKLEGINFKIVSKLIGGSSIDQFGSPLSSDTLEECASSDAIFLGAVGGPKWENLPHEIKIQNKRS